MIRRALKAALGFLTVAALLIFRRGARQPESAGTPPRQTSVVPLLDWKWWVVTAGVFMLLAGAGGFAVMLSGVISIKASAGHWRITETLLQLGKRRSLATHAFGTRVPRLDDPALVLRGAGHYEIGCRPCHGSPDLPAPRIAQSMLPRPPYLPRTLHRYEPAELFQLVKHGIKLTGMPAWPSQRRDDEVWAMVAFLQRFRAMGAAEYRQLAHGPVPASDDGAPIEELDPGGSVPRVVTETCSRCHGSSGTGRGAGAFPKIAGQRPAYLRATLIAYASGSRHSGIMGPVAAALQPAQLDEAADYYARLAPPEAAAAGAAAAEGERIALRGVPERDIPACASCHGPGQERPNANYPNLAGQYAAYLALQLDLFRNDSRGGTSYHRIMQTVAQRLTPEHIAAVTGYYASLPWPGHVPAGR